MRCESGQASGRTHVVAPDGQRRVLAHKGAFRSRRGRVRDERVRAPRVQGAVAGHLCAVWQEGREGQKQHVYIDSQQSTHAMLFARRGFSIARPPEHRL
jgi:hypothetical protein